MSSFTGTLSITISGVGQSTEAQQNMQTAAMIGFLGLFTSLKITQAEEALHSVRNWHAATIWVGHCGSEGNTFLSALLSQQCAHAAVLLQVSQHIIYL